MVFASKSLFEFILVNVRFLLLYRQFFYAVACDSLIIIPQTDYNVNCFEKLFKEIFSILAIDRNLTPLSSDSLHNISYTSVLSQLF